MTYINKERDNIGMANHSHITTKQQTNKKLHTDDSIELKEFLADLTPVPTNTLLQHSQLAELAPLLDEVDNLAQSVLYLENNIPIFTGTGKGEMANTANSITLVLRNNTNTPATLVSYPIENQSQRPYIHDTAVPSGFILGSMSRDSDWWCVSNLDEGIKLYEAMSAIEPVTVIVAINQYQFTDTVQHFAEVNQVNINVTHEHKDSYAQQLAGVNAQLWVTPVIKIADCAMYGDTPTDLMNTPETECIDLAMMVWGEPEPLTNDTSKPTPYPIKAWSGLLKQVIEKIAYYAQVPHAMAGQCVLGALAHMGQRYVNAPLGFGYQPTSLILITEGESGSGKSSAMKLSHYEINIAEKQQYQIYNEQLTNWERDKATLTGKELKEFLATEPMPVNKESIFQDGTIEPILDKYINGEVIFASWSTDEAGQFFNSHTMKGDTAGSAMSAITKLYDDGSISRLRSQKGVNANPRTQAHDIRFTMFLMGQRVILEPALTNPILNGQGILARALIACPDSLQGQRVWNDPQRRQQSPYTDSVLQAYWDRCKSLLDPVAIKDPDYEVATGGRPNRLNMTWDSAETEQAFYEGMQRIESKQNKGGLYEHLKAYASRMGQNASRIACLLAFFDERTSITTDDINRAFMMVDYCMSERLRYLEISNEQSDSEKLNDWLVKKVKGKNPPRLNRTTVYNGCPKPMLKNNRLLQSELDNLESMGYIEQKIEGRKKVIYINPHLIKQQE